MGRGCHISEVAYGKIYSLQYIHQPEIKDKRKFALVYYKMQRKS